MIGYDGDDEWIEVMAYCAEFAASKYAEKLDDGSGGELLRDGRGSERCLVKDAGGMITTFDITVEFSKDFYARAVAD
jgi:hypothetical protein